MKRTPTHFLTLNEDGTSHARPLAKNVPGGCACGGKCGTKPERSRDLTLAEIHREARKTREKIRDVLESRHDYVEGILVDD